MRRSSILARSLSLASLVWMGAAGCSGDDSEDSADAASSSDGSSGDGDAAPSADASESSDQVSVPAGTFWMGCNETLDDECFTDELPYHEVTVPAFSIDLYEATIADYTACVNAGACTEPDNASAFYSDWCNWGVADRDDHPVNCVTWQEAIAYCEWAGKRLCTEAEWEKAARGGCELYGDCAAESRRYPWGDQDASCDYAVYDLDDVTDWGCDTGFTWPVGSKPAGASPYGLLDISGNVNEWVRDCYHPDYVGTPPTDVPPLDGSAWESPACAELNKVVKGGSMYDHDHQLRTSYRLSRPPEQRIAFQGIRCCK